MHRYGGRMITLLTFALIGAFGLLVWRVAYEFHAEDTEKIAHQKRKRNEI